MNTPANIIRLLDNGNLQDILQMQRHINTNALVRLSQPLSFEEVTEIVNFLDQEIGVSLLPAQVVRLFDLYPEFKARIIDGGMDTEAKSAVCAAVAKFFLNCDWPVFGDKIDFDKFNAALQKAVPIMRPLL